MHARELELPRLLALARHAVPHVVEGTLVPVALFYLVLKAVGATGALAVALAWSYGALATRLVFRRRLPGLLVLGTLTLTARTVAALATGSVFVYFLQPTLATVGLASAFLLSLPAGQPLAERLAADFLPLPAGVLRHPAMRRFFQRVTLLWAFVLLANAGLTLWLLVSQPLATFVLARAGVSVGFTATGVALSLVWFRRSVRLHGLRPGPARPGG